MITRRRFLQHSGAVTSALLINKLPGMPQSAPVKPDTMDPNTLAKFVDPLPIPSVAQPFRSEPDPDNPKIKLPYYASP